MARPRALNPDGAPARLEAVELSRELLHAARGLERPGESAELEALAAQLHGIHPERIAGDERRIAFWLNVYNALILHCLALRPLRGSLLRHLRLFDRIAYRVGGEDYPLNLIEHGLLRRNARPPYRPRRLPRANDPRLAAAPARLDPRIHFALNCGAVSCPPIRSYAGGGLDEQLELATRSYLRAETRLDPVRRRLKLPRLMRLYRADFGTRDEQLALAARHLRDVEDWLEPGRSRLKIGYGRFDWTVAEPR
jgi:hypothetical protein